MTQRQVWRRPTRRFAQELDKNLTPEKIPVHRGLKLHRIEGIALLRQEGDALVLQETRDVVSHSLHVRGHFGEENRPLRIDRRTRFDLYDWMRRNGLGNLWFRY